MLLMLAVVKRLIGVTGKEKKLSKLGIRPKLVAVILKMFLFEVKYKLACLFKATPCVLNVKSAAV